MQPIHNNQEHKEEDVLIRRNRVVRHSRMVCYIVFNEKGEVIKCIPLVKHVATKILGDPKEKQK